MVVATAGQCSCGRFLARKRSTFCYRRSAAVEMCGGKPCYC
jgi:hypothetical protein